jgi:peptidoglycan hydrolase-like protein with peptidoglycan-binding domain
MARILSINMKGEDIRLIQKAFNVIVLGGVAPDGLFGVRTRARVIDFQHTDGRATPDGMVGPLTRAIIAEALRRGPHNPQMLSFLIRNTTPEELARAVVEGKEAFNANPFDFRAK